MFGGCLVVLERARVFGGVSPFVGHVGGDDFIVVVEPQHAEELARELVGAFDARVPGWYAGQPGAEQMARRMTISIGVVDTQVAGVKSLEELAKALATAKRASKRTEGSNYVVFNADQS